MFAPPAGVTLASPITSQVCNHPYQLPGAEADPDDTGLEDLVEASGKLRMLDRMLAKLKAAGHRVVLFSQFTHMLDVLERYIKARGYKYSRLDGSRSRMRCMRARLAISG